MMMERIKQVLNSPLGKRKNGISTRKIFGVSLEEQIKSQSQAQTSLLENDGQDFKSPNVPFIVDRICRFIFANGIEEEGIFRVNGNSRVVEKLKDCFEKHGDADLESAEDIFSVAGLLKLFLRELPEAVVPEHMTSHFVKCQQVYKQDKVEYIKQLKLLLEDLPPCHYDLLKYTIRFLVDVAAKESNKMSSMGLAIVFGPNLFRCSAGIEGLRDQGITNEIVCKFLTEYTTLFGELTEPGPFTIPYIHQNREKRRLAVPLRPPPPKLTDNLLSLSMDTLEETRPTTSLSQEFMERASPFTIVEGDGHSSIASPVLSAVASELVTKTISEAVLEHLFSATEVKSIFDNWGENEDAGSRASTSHSTRHGGSHTIHKTAPPASNSALDESHDTQVKEAPSPKPRSAKSSEDHTLGSQPTPKPRTHKHKVVESMSESQTLSPEHPKPKPRTKSAPARPSALADAPLHHSIDMPVVVVSDSKTSLSNHPPANKSVITPVNADFDHIASFVTQLRRFDKPRGPVKKVPRKKKRHVSVRADPSTKDVGDINNNNNDDSVKLAAVPLLEIDNQNVQKVDLQGQETVIVVQSVGNEETTTPPVSTFDNTLEVGRGDHMLSTTPQGPPIDGLSPDPRAQQRNAIEDEQRTAQIKTLSKKINALKKKVRAFEESFETEHGHKPSAHEKNSKIEIKKALADLAKSRKELKSLGVEEDFDLKEQGVDNTRVDSIEPPAVNVERAGSGTESVNMGTSHEPATMADTLELLLKKLKEKRQEANRADDLSVLTRDQVQEEKLAVQKALLHFESIHGRPQTKSEKELMRPLYDRYRQIKKALVSAPVSLPQEKPVESALPEAVAVEADPTEMLVTQHPDMNNEHNGLPPGDDEDREESPADPGKAARETNLQDLLVPELKSELDKANNTKKKLRKLLRDFEDEFQKENNRKVQRDDRGPMESKYQEYKQIKARIKLLEVLLSKHE